MKPNSSRDVWHKCFFGQIKVPPHVSHKKAEALAFIAWKGGTGEDRYLKSFSRWFRKFADSRPDLAIVKVFPVYPVDEFRWIGEYESSGYVLRNTYAMCCATTTQEVGENDA